MAPELIRTDPMSKHGGRAYDAAMADVWSMGVTLYLMVVGWYPFEDPNHPRDMSVTLRNVCMGNYRSLPERLHGTDCADLISRMLNPNPVNRLSIEDVRRHQWVSTD